METELFRGTKASGVSNAAPQAGSGASTVDNAFSHDEGKTKTIGLPPPRPDMPIKKPEPIVPEEKTVVQIGDKLNDRYILEDVIGIGGMGIVFKARDTTLKKPVAIKILGEKFKQYPDARQQMLQEVKIAQELSHDNIIRVNDIEHDSRLDEYFMTMEYLDGQSLQDVLREPEGRLLQRDKAYFIIEGIAEALIYSHVKKRCVHSDIKPSNVFLVQNSNSQDISIKVLDFGIARAVRDNAIASGNTLFRTEDINAYSIPYASPETMEGLPPDYRDDVYSLAYISYLLLSGRHPFGSEGVRLGSRYSQVTGALLEEPIPGLSGRQWKALKKGLEFVRNKRTATIAEFLKGIRPKPRRDWRIIAAVSALTGFSLLAVYLGVTSKDVTMCEDYMDRLGKIPDEPTDPSIWLDEARYVRSCLTADPTKQDEAASRLLKAKIDSFVMNCQKARTYGDTNGAEAFIGLAEALEIDQTLVSRSLCRPETPPPHANCSDITTRLEKMSNEPIPTSKWLAEANYIRGCLANTPFLLTQDLRSSLSHQVRAIVDKCQVARNNDEDQVVDGLITLANLLNFEPAINPSELCAPDPEKQLLNLIPRLNGFPVRLNKSVYMEMDPIEISIEVPTATDSIHVFGFQRGEKPVLLFPNKKNQDNHGLTGLYTIKNIVASTPYGKAWIIAVAESGANNLYRQYSKSKSQTQQKFVTLSVEELLNFLNNRSANEVSTFGQAEMAICPQGKEACE